MKTPVSLLGLALLTVAVGCGQEANQPQTVQQQAEMAKGHPPTKEELAKAMSRFQAPPGPPATPPGQGAK